MWLISVPTVSRVPAGPPYSGYSLAVPQITQGRDRDPETWALFPARGAHWPRGRSASSLKPPGRLGLGGVFSLVFPKPSRGDIERGASAYPACGKTTGPCPQFPPNLGPVPGTSSGLGVARGHWGLPPGSCSPSAASTARHTALTRPRPRLLRQPAAPRTVSSPPPRRPRPAPASVPTRAATAEAHAGRGDRLRAGRSAATALPQAARPETRATFVGPLARIPGVGKAARSPRRGARGAPRRGAPRPGGTAPAAWGCGEARAERGPSD